MTGRRFAVSAAAALALAACSGEGRAPAAARDSAVRPLASQAAATRPDTGAAAGSARGWVVSFDGVGPVRIGMTEAQARAALGDRLERGGAAGEGCAYASVAGAEGLRLMISGGRVARVDVRSPSIPTAAGARVGDVEARIRQLYGAGLQIQPHKYQSGHYLIVAAPTDTARRLIFETLGDTVTMFRAGARPEIDWVEGCS